MGHVCFTFRCYMYYMPSLKKDILNGWGGDVLNKKRYTRKK